MKKSIIKVILFITGLCLILTALSALFRPEYDVYDIKESENVLKRLDSDPENTVDILFAGNSEAADGFAPLKLWKDYGYSSENTAYPSQRFGDAYAMLKQIVEKQSPELLVIETDTLFSEADPFYNKDAVSSAAERIFTILHYHKVIRLLKPYSTAMTESNKNANKGYWLRRGVRAYTGGNSYLERKGKKSTAFKASASGIMDQVIALCEENNIEILLVTVPGPNYFTVARHDYIQQWADEHGIEYIDLNYYCDEMGIDWTTDSKDAGDHLNHNGALKMNAWFGAYLNEHYDMQDHRGEEGYESWQEACDALGGVY